MNDQGLTVLTDDMRRVVLEQKLGFGVPSGAELHLDGVPLAVALVRVGTESSLPGPVNDLRIL